LASRIQPSMRKKMVFVFESKSEKTAVQQEPPEFSRETSSPLYCTQSMHLKIDRASQRNYTRWASEAKNVVVRKI